MNKFLPAVIQAVKEHRFSILYSLQSPSTHVWLKAAKEILHA